MNERFWDAEIREAVNRASGIEDRIKRLQAQEPGESERVKERRWQPPAAGERDFLAGERAGAKPSKHLIQL